MKEYNKIPQKLWFENLAFNLSYGIKGLKKSIGEPVYFKNFQLKIGSESSELAQFIKLSPEDKLKTIEAVFSNAKGDLVLRIPFSSLYKLQ